MLRRTLAIAGAGLILSLELLSSALPAGTDQWKDESPEAAERQLEKMRSAASKLDRFEVECLISQVDNTFAKDERWRLRVYAEEGTGFRVEMRSVDLKHMTAPNNVRRALRIVDQRFGNLGLQRRHLHRISRDRSDLRRREREADELAGSNQIVASSIHSSVARPVGGLDGAEIAVQDQTGAIKRIRVRD